MTVPENWQQHSSVVARKEGVYVSENKNQRSESVLWKKAGT